MRRTRKYDLERGGAMVELVVLMLVFIPLILLPMYFQDAFRYKLDYQEAVSSTAWDFAFQNYEDDKIQDVAGTVESFNRKLYANLWSGNERNKKNPAGPWADFDWEDSITCEGDKDFGKCYTLASSTFHSEYTKGGLAHCKGAISVSNHYIPRVFLQEFAQKNLFDPGKNALRYPEYEFGMLVDPWCVTGCNGRKCPRKSSQTKDFDVEKAGSGKHPAKEFYNRVKLVWGQELKGLPAASYMYFQITWIDFIFQLISKEIGSPLLTTTLMPDPPIFDNPTVLKLTSLHLPDRNQRVSVGGGGRSQFFVSPFEDGGDNKYQKTFENRKSYYLGCKSFGPNCH